MRYMVIVLGILIGAQGGAFMLVGATLIGITIAVIALDSRK